MALTISAGTPVTITGIENVPIGTGSGNTITTTQAIANLTVSNVASAYFVNAATGNDSNDGLSSGSAFLTIQKALNVVNSKIINKNVTVNIAAGTYAERLNHAPTIFAGDYRITLLGATTVLDSGTAGSSTGYSYSAGVVPAILTDGSKSWTVNTFVRKLLRITGGTGFNGVDDELNWYVIRANTATTLKICGDFNAVLGASTTYQILDLTSIVSGSGSQLANIALRGDRMTLKAMSFTQCVGFPIAAFSSKLNEMYGCYVTGGAGASNNIGVINAGFRAIACMLDASTNSLAYNIAFYEAFSMGDYDENFLTSNANVNSKTGIKGCLIQGGTSAGLQCSNSHSRLTGNLFTVSTIAIELGRIGDLSIYGNDMTGMNITINDNSYLKIHSGNICTNVTASNSSVVYKQNAGGWFTSAVSLITAPYPAASLYGAGFTATTETTTFDKLALSSATLSGSSATDNWLSLVATMPSTMTTTTRAINIDVTSAGSSSFAGQVLRVNYGAGYAGITQTQVGNFVNSAAGTNTTAPTMATSSGNSSLYGYTNSTTTGHNYGLTGQAANGNINFGVIGQAQTLKNSATNIGVLGFGLNTGTSPVFYGGIFATYASATAIPAYSNSALVADNGSQAIDIFGAYDNAGLKVRIADGGFMFVGGATAPTAILHLAAGTSTASTSPLKFTSGTNLTTAEAGAWEYDGINFYATPSGTIRKTVSCNQVARSVAQTAAVANVVQWTVGASDGSFEISANVLITAATTHSFTVTCAYTDEGNTARTVTLNFSTVAGVISNAAITNVGGTVPYEGVPLHIRCKAATTITIATTGTFTSVTYNVEGRITQIS